MNVTDALNDFLKLTVGKVCHIPQSNAGVVHLPSLGLKLAGG